MCTLTTGSGSFTGGSGFLTSSSTFLGCSAVTLESFLVRGSEVDTDGVGTGAAAASTGLSTGEGSGALDSVVDDAADDVPLPIPDRKDNVLPGGGGFGLSSEGVGAFVGIAAAAFSSLVFSFFSSGHESGLGVGCVSGGFGAALIELLLFVTSDVGNVDFSGMVDGCVIVVDSSAGLTGGIDVSFGGGGLLSPSPLLEGGRLGSI